MTEYKQAPWAGDLSIDLRKGALSVSADGLTMIDAKGVCWGIVFPNKDGFYDHAAFVTDAVNRYAALLRRVTALEMVIRQEIYPFECYDEANRMIVEDIHERFSIPVGAGKQP